MHQRERKRRDHEHARDKEGSHEVQRQLDGQRGDPQRKHHRLSMSIGGVARTSLLMAAIAMVSPHVMRKPKKKMPLRARRQKFSALERKLG